MGSHLEGSDFMKCKTFVPGLATKAINQSAQSRRPQRKPPRRSEVSGLHASGGAEAAYFSKNSILH